MAKRNSSSPKKNVLVSYSPTKVFVLSGLVLVLALTVIMIRQPQSTQQYAAKSCVDRPSCLDAKPYACALPEPTQGWCPKPTEKVVLPSPTK